MQSDASIMQDTPCSHGLFNVLVLSAEMPLGTLPLKVTTSVAGKLTSFALKV